MNTENIAYEKRYRDWWAQYDAMFAPENRSPQQDEQFPLTDGYSIRSKAYLYDGNLHLCGTSLTWTTPDLTILSLSAGTTTACFFGAATQRMIGGKKFECRWNS